MCALVAEMLALRLKIFNGSWGLAGELGETGACWAERAASQVCGLSSFAQWALTCLSMLSVSSIM